MANARKNSWKAAVMEVLQTANKAMHYTDIAAEIQKRGLRADVGATPAATVNVVLHDSIKRDGDESPFLKVGVGEFVLKSSVGRSSGRTLQTRPESSATAAEDEAAADEAAETGGIIKAFGMFWRRERIDWATKPLLLGQQQEGADPVNFAEQYGVYLLHDGREVVYVGRMTEKRLATRLSEHTRDRLNGRWDRFSWFGLLPVTREGKLGNADLSSISLEDVIVTLEALLVEGLEPRQNRKRGDAFRAVEYLQAADPALLKKSRKKVAEEILASWSS